MDTLIILKVKRDDLIFDCNKIIQEMQDDKNPLNNMSRHYLLSSLVDELNILNKLKSYQEKANRDRFILPIEKEINFFIEIIENCINFFN